MQVSQQKDTSQSTNKGLDLDSAWETTLTYRLAMQVIFIKVKISRPVLDYLIRHVPQLTYPEEYGLLYQRLDLLKLHFYVSIRIQLRKKFGLTKHGALQTLHTYLFHKDFIVKDAPVNNMR